MTEKIWYHIYVIHNQTDEKIKIAVIKSPGLLALLMPAIEKIYPKERFDINVE